MALSKDGLNRIKSIFTAVSKYVDINNCNEITGLNGGEETESRWDVKDTKVEKHRLQLIESITTAGFLTAIIAIKAPEDVVLFGKTYPKGSYMVLDESGRTRVLQHLVNEAGYVINPGTEFEGKVPLLDVTHLILKDGKVTEDAVQRIWLTIVKLNINSYDWTDYGFLSSGSRAITDHIQKELWTYLASTMKKYHPTLSNKVILGGTIGALTDKMINEAYIDFDLDTYRRYSNYIFEGLLKIRNEWGISATKAPFLKALARYSFLSAKNNGFEAGDYDTQGSPILSTHDTLFEIDSLLQIGTDTHFKEFVYNFDMIVEGLRHILPPKGGYAGTEASARREFKENIYRWYNSLKGKGLLK